MNIANCKFQIALAGLALALWGCAGTVVPNTVTVASASWDGTNQNSGFVGWAPDGSGIITAHARDRYNALVKVYGGRFAGPGLQMDEGLTPTGTNTWLIDPQHLEYFAGMNRWRRDGATPP